MLDIHAFSFAKQSSPLLKPADLTIWAQIMEMKYSNVARMPVLEIPLPIIPPLIA